MGPLGTSVEGPAEAVWAVLRQAHEACLTAGADRILSVIKVYEGSGEGTPQDTTMAGLTHKFRP